MTNREVVELRVLGTLEARRGATLLPLGGAKQRSVLAALLLHAGEVLSRATVIDEVWGDDPPPSAAHSVEVYVSRLRRVFRGSEVQLVRRGAGYAAVLDGAVLDSRQFEHLADEAQRAAAEGDDELAARTSARALSLWRGRLLDDVELGPAGRSRGARLEEARLRTLEVRFDAELALGRHEQVVGELQAVVDQHPYRERFVSQLMHALYRCGRQADALAAYEQTRRLLDDELGLQPSAALQQLSARIVRQERGLELSAGPAPSHDVARHEPRARRLARLALVAGVVGSALTLATSGSTSQPVSRGDRVALVVPEDPAESVFEESRANNRLSETRAGFADAAERFGMDAETLTIDEVTPAAAEIEQLVRRIEQGAYDLVLLPGDRASARLIAPHVAAHPRTRFVFVDATLDSLGLVGVRNATAVRFAFEHSARLAGAASGLVTARGVLGPWGTGAIAVVAGIPDRETRRTVAGFREGVEATLPGARVRVDYTGELLDLAACERAANEQITGGARIILVVAGRCGSGAVAVAHARQAWVAGEDEYGVGDRQSGVIASMFKSWEQAAWQALAAYAAGSLPVGDDLELGVDDDYATGTVLSDAVPAPIQGEVLELCTRLREQAASEGRA